jgi:Xaa-Pro aminopeptidase
MGQESELAEIYSKRRQSLMEQMADGIALIEASGQAPDPLLNDKNLMYLTGDRTRDSILVLAPKGIRVDRFETLQGPAIGRGRIVQELLFVRELTEREKLIDGESSDYEVVEHETGIEVVKPLSKMEEILSEALVRTEQLWVNVGWMPAFDAPLTRGQQQINKIRERYPWLRISNAAPLIHEMRRTKDAHEVACLRRAFEIHAEIFTEIMATLKPGDNEGLGKAIYDYGIGKRAGDGVRGDWDDDYVANIIVATGANSAIGHYMDNNQQIEDGDLVLIDTGVEYKNYSSDITRTFPANGKFSDRQREIYAITLEAQKAAIATMKPGSTSHDAHMAVYETFKDYGLENNAYGTCGHPVGLNIHDACGWKSDDDLPFEPGHVLVIEPFVMLPDEGFGVRIEAGVLITENGCEVLAGPPKEIDEVEALCARG